MKNVLEKIDIFGEPVRIFMEDKKYKKTTAIGGLITILIIFIGLIFSWYVGKDLFLKQNPVTYKQEQVANYAKITIDKYNFPFAIGLTDEFGQPYYNERMFTHELRLHVLKVNSSGIMNEVEVIDIELNRCNYSDFPNLNHTLYDAAQLNNFLCVKNQNITVQGYWTETELRFLKSSVSMCEIDANHTECESREYIEDFIKKNILSYDIFYTDNLIHYNEYSSPLEKFISNPYKFIQLNVNKMVNYWVNYNNIITDSGLVWPEVSRLDEFITLEELQTDSVIYDPLRKELLSFNLFAANKKTIFHREYIRLTQVIGVLGGLSRVAYYFFEAMYSKILMVSLSSNIDFFNDIFLGHNGEKYLKKNSTNKEKKRVFDTSIEEKIHSYSFNNAGVSSHSGFLKAVEKEKTEELLINTSSNRKVSKKTKNNERHKLKLSYCEKLKIIISDLCTSKRAKENKPSIFDEKLDIYHRLFNEYSRVFERKNIIIKMILLEDLLKEKLSGSPKATNREIRIEKDDIHGANDKYYSGYSSEDNNKRTYYSLT